MDLKEKYMVFCAIIITIAPVFLSSLTGNITASDWTYRHTWWISRYLHGDFTPSREYPPLFHLMLAPFVAINFPVVWFQVLFVTISTTSLLYFVYSFNGVKPLILTSFLLASNIAYVSFAGSLMPQALDYIFFVIVLFFYFKNKYVFTIIGLILSFFMHLTGAIFTLILFLHSLKMTDKMRPSLISIALLILGLILLIPLRHYTSPASTNPIMKDVKWDIEAQAEWEAQFLKFPDFFILSGFLMWGLLPFAIKKLWKEKFKLTEIQLLYVLWIICFIPTGFYGLGWWRMTTYIVVPLSLLVASLVSDDEILKF